MRIQPHKDRRSSGLQGIPGGLGTTESEVQNPSPKVVVKVVVVVVEVQEEVVEVVVEVVEKVVVLCRNLAGKGIYPAVDSSETSHHWTSN